jgi:hypothetical protein
MCYHFIFEVFAFDMRGTIDMKYRRYLSDYVCDLIEKYIYFGLVIVIYLSYLVHIDTYFRFDVMCNDIKVYFLFTIIYIYIYIKILSDTEFYPTPKDIVMAIKQLCPCFINA